MKIEIGESLLQSYLKHVENCLISQTNWKTSSNWNIDPSCRKQIDAAYNKIRADKQFSDVFKKNNLDQILKQAEIDVLGLEKNTVFMVEVAFHLGGLNYGKKNETKNKIFEKFLRAYLIGLAFFPNKELKIIFASPKTYPATKKLIDEYFDLLEKKFSSKTVHFQFITNEDFKDKILIPTLNKTSSDEDTGELFLRSYKLLRMYKLVEDLKNVGTQIPVTASSMKQSSPKPSYTYNGKTYNQRDLCLAVIKDYVNQNRNITIDQLKQTWNFKGMRRAILDAKELKQNQRTRKDYFLDNNDLLKLSDGIAVVSTQWTGDLVDEFIKIAKKEGFTIQKN